MRFHCVVSSAYFFQMSMRVDNKPIYDRANIEVQVYENTEVGKTLEKFVANDPDQGGKSKVSFAIDRTSDRQRQFSINQEGVVKIQRTLDREVTPRHQVKILAIDDGIPPKTATATLTVIVQDINGRAFLGGANGIPCFNSKFYSFSIR